MTLALFIEELPRNPAFFLQVVVAVVVSIVLHELGHGLAALWQGDDTARRTGHLTLDPTVHMPPFSWLLLVVAGIAYGATPVDPTRFRSRYGEAFVSFAGPFVNLALAFLALTALGVWLSASDLLEEGFGASAQRFLSLLGELNILLLLFNLLPVPPLDGSTILGNAVPAYRRAIRDPNMQPIFLGGFVLVFFFAGELWEAARAIAGAYLRLLVHA